VYQHDAMSKGPAAPKTALTPTRADDYAEWYQQVIKAADLAEVSPVRGCMVIKPWGFAIWENVQRDLDAMIKATGHRNAYFPLFIPKSFLEKEAAHVEGFAKECAVVTHHRLIQKEGGGLTPDPEAKLEEELIVRPTSETIIGEMFAKWVQSYRDLPLLINQWANVVRWELRTRMFLRTAEFLWQEGHTAHATEEEARAETAQMLGVYATFAEQHMAMPVIQGAKTESERFPGAVDTYAIEAMMQDRKALQAGTSHFLGQNFARAAEIRFQSQAGGLEHAWTTSWGMSTRMVGGLIMTHSDDDGLVLPPRIAPSHVVVLPILRGEGNEKVISFCQSLAAELRAQQTWGRPLQVELDQRDIRGGDKTWEWIKKGIPLRIEVGGREVDANSVSLSRRDRPHKERATIARPELAARVVEILQEMQTGLFERARAFRREHTRRIADRAAFTAWFTPKNEDKPEIHGGFALSGWCGARACEDAARELKVTIRCLPLGEVETADGGPPADRCVICGQPAKHQAIFAKNY
jgi:prolyl-tRNA synthetase